MSFEYSSKTEEFKKISIGNTRSTTKKDKKNKSISQWNIKLPLQLQYDSNNLPIDNNNLPIDNINQQQKLTQYQQSLHSLLNHFIKYIIQQKFHSQTLDQIINTAQNIPLSQLWNTQYTNNLALSLQLINKSLSNNKTSTKSITPGHIQDYQNKDQSNIDSDQQENQQNNKKKKRKIKKSSHNKKYQNTPHKDIINPNKQTPQQLNLSHQINKLLDNKETIQKTLTLNLMLQKIQKEIIRVQNLFIQEIQNIHILPYVQAEEKLFQSQSKPIKKNINKLNPEKMYPLEGMEKEYISGLTYGFSNQPNLNLNNRQNAQFPLLNYEYQMGQSAQMSQPQYQYHMAEQHMKSYGIPLMPMNPNFVQHMGQLNGQYMNTQGVFSYGSENLMMMSQNMGINRGVNKNNKGSNMIDIENDEDDGVQEVGPMKKN